MPNADPAKGQLEGVDSSHWQGTIYPKVGKEKYGIEWWAIKATEGLSYVDPTFKQAQNDLRDSGIKYVGYYHFPRGNKSIEGQVEHFVNTIGPLQVGEFAKLDDESSESLGYPLTCEQAALWHKLVEAHYGRPTCEYTGAFVKNPSDRFYHWDYAPIRDSTLGGERPNILASYNSWAKVTTRGRPVHVWQWTSTAHFPGLYSGGIDRIDRDLVLDPHAYDAACGYTNEPSPPDPPPVVVEPIPGGNDMTALRVPETPFDSRDGFGTVPAGWANWINLGHPEVQSATIHITVEPQTPGWIKIWDPAAGSEPKGATVDYTSGISGVDALVPLTGGQIFLKTSAALKTLIITVQGGS